MKSLLVLLLTGGLALPSSAPPAQRQTENVVLITLDGLRWQEVFSGADTTLFGQRERYYPDRAALRHTFGQGTAPQRRQALMPFLWGTVARQGQLYGNRPRGSFVNVTNTHWFSYPGYNELLTGAADDARIRSNEPVPNPNVTVLEALHQQPAFRGRVAAVGSWQVLSAIINEPRSGVPVHAGPLPAAGPDVTARERLLNQVLAATPSPFKDVRFDAFTGYYALEYLRRKKPRVLYISFGDTDEFAHVGEYGAYLHAAHYTDELIRQLWEYLQSEPQYRGKTTLLITTDHGRGGAANQQWRHHGVKYPGSDQIWLAVLGPDTQALGEASSGQLYQNQVAATLAQLLGVAYVPRMPVGAVIPAIVGEK